MKKIRKLQANDPRSTCKGFLDSGSDMFGFSHPEILKLIKVYHYFCLSLYSFTLSKYCCVLERVPYHI